MDFFSWHIYATSPLQVRSMADQVRALLDKLHLPTVYEGELDGVMELVMQDKKKVENGIVCVVLTGIGRFSFVRMGEDELRCRMKEAFA